MGGDHFPKSEVGGAVLAAKHFGVKVILVGREDVIRQELELHGNWDRSLIEVHHASEQITMDDSAAKPALKDSSMRIAPDWSGMA
ncbi:MAG: hypothetical protein WKF37_00080 [Bryobacteraceae bacterium]